MDKSLTSAPVGASEQAFHAMVARSRDEQPAGLAERLARLDGEPGIHLSASILVTWIPGSRLHRAPE